MGRVMIIGLFEFVLYDLEVGRLKYSGGRRKYGLGFGYFLLFSFKCLVFFNDC